LQIKIAEKNYQSAKADYNQSNALFLPNINVSHTGISTTNPLMAFGSKLNQAILTPMADFNPNLLNMIQLKTQNFATKFSIPILSLPSLKCSLQTSSLPKSAVKLNKFISSIFSK
jgi:hypothetical protein